MAIDYTKTEVYLLNVPLDSENNHTYYFKSKEEQTTFFTNKRITGEQNLTYQRKGNVIRYPASVDDINHCNYVMYRNLTHKDKWYYAFIMDMRFLSEGLTEIEIKIDPIQTYLLECTIGSCFVEREHVTDDTEGLHTIPENLETGEYVGDYIEPATNPDWLTYNRSNCVPVVAVTELPNGWTYNYDNNCEVPSGTYYIGCLTIDDAKRLCVLYNEGKAEAISHIFIAPKYYFGSFNECALGDTGLKGYYSTALEHEYSSSVRLVKPDKLSQGKAPRNNKLLTYPYSYLQVSNNSGTIVNYSFEDFKDPSDNYRVEFRCIGTITPGGSTRVYPLEYKGKSANYDEGLSYGKLPIGGWVSDVYTNWLTQNSVNLSVQAISSFATFMAGSVLMLTGAGAMAGLGLYGAGFAGMSNAVAQVVDRSKIPDQAKGNVNVGDVNYQFSLTGIKFSHISIKNEYAEIIDSYFDMYGYKVNSVKVPNKDHRNAYWFTKTIDANITGPIPKQELQKIIDCYNKGITFWRPNFAFRSYTHENYIV